MTINLEIFGCLNDIRKTYGITGVQWVAACDIKYPARLTELTIMLENQRNKQHDEKVGRAFSIHKCQSLIAGLKNLLGGEIVKKELFKFVERYPDRDQRILLMCLALDEKDQEQVELFLKAILKIGK